MNSDPQKMYERINPKVDMACKIVVSGTIKFVLPVVMFANLIFNYFQYFIMSLQSDAFVLPCPFWWALTAQNLLIHICRFD